MSTEMLDVVGTVNGYVIASCLVYLAVAVPLFIIKKTHSRVLGIPYYAWAGLVSSALIVTHFITVVPIH
jgi:hypothetical protein